MSALWKRRLAELASLTETLRDQHPAFTAGAPNRDQWDAWWQTADRVRKQLAVDGPELLRRAAEPSVDGYGSQSGAAAGGGPKGTVSRPTQRLALSKVASEAACHQFAGDPGFPCDRCQQDAGDHRDLDPVRHHVLRMVYHTGAAVGFFQVARDSSGDGLAVLRYVDYGIRRLVKANDHRARALPPVVVEEPKEGGCGNCQRWGVYERVWKAERCRACHAYRSRHGGSEAPMDLVRARDSRRIERDLEKKAGGR